MGSASAGYTFKDKGYKYKMSTKELKKHKKYAKKHSRCYSHHKVSKNVKYDTMEKLKVGKTYKNIGKVLKLVKIYESSIYGGGGYQYLVKKSAHMSCHVDYEDGSYYYYANAY